MTLRQASTVVLAVGLSVALAACGGGSQPRHRGSGSGGATANDVKFSRCMRAHGLTNFPDVIANQGMPIQHELNGGIDILVNGNAEPVNGPAFNAAMGVCQHYVADIMTASPGAGITPGTIQHALVRTATCMRHNGVPDYPDPPALGTQQKGHFSPSARARDAGINIESPAFKAALAKCGSIMNNAMGR